MPDAVLADDEPLMRDQLRLTLRALWPELAIVGEAGNGAQAVELVATLKPAVAFLDIEMPGLNGLQVAAQVKDMTHIVFVTAFERYAVDAFEQGAIDYVLKPASAARITETITRLKRRVDEPLASTAELHASLLRLSAALGRPPETVRLKWIHATVAADVRLIPVDEVLYFQSDHKYTRVVTPGGEALIRKTVRDLIEELDPDEFWQVHRATLVNSRAISHVTREDGRLFVVLKQGRERLEISRTFSQRFRSM
jgi:DNA-binding LytR/AlgR family response regulator